MHPPSFHICLLIAVGLPRLESHVNLLVDKVKESIVLDSYSQRNFINFILLTSYLKLLSKMNYWKVAFFVTLMISILILSMAIYIIVDQSLTIAHNNHSYYELKKDIAILSRIISKSGLQKTSIIKMLIENKLIDTENISRDTLFLNQSVLIFRDEQMLKITMPFD